MDRTVSAVVSGTAVLAAATTGAVNGLQRPTRAVWYALLRKPPFTPSGTAVGATWTVLELLLVATGYRLLRAAPSDDRSAALGGWALTLLGLAVYPWLFFGRRRLGSGAAAAAAMVAGAAGTVATARRVDRPAAAMTVPLVLWLGFATLLSEELWRRNRLLSRD